MTGVKRKHQEKVKAIRFSEKMIESIEKETSSEYAKKSRYEYDKGSDSIY